MKGYPGLSDEAAESLDKEIKNGYSWEQKPYPSYLLSNNNTNIKRIRARIAELEKRAEAPAEGWGFDGGRVEMNTEQNRIQILFDGKPDQDMRSELKSRGFRWAPSQGAWQRQLTANGIYAAKKVTGKEETQ